MPKTSSKHKIKTAKQDAQVRKRQKCQKKAKRALAAGNMRAFIDCLWKLAYEPRYAAKEVIDHPPSLPSMDHFWLAVLRCYAFAAEGCLRVPCTSHRQSCSKLANRKVGFVAVPEFGNLAQFVAFLILFTVIPWRLRCPWALFAVIWTRHLKASLWGVLPIFGTRVQCLQAPATEAVKSLRTFVLARNLMAGDTRQRNGKYLSVKLAPYLGEEVEYKAKLFWNITGSTSGHCCCC